MSGSHRLVDYVVLTQLSDANLGGIDVSNWAKDMHKLIPPPRRSKKINKFTLNALSSAHLLTSAHPRSVELLVESFSNNELSNKRNHAWDGLHGALKNPDTAFPTVLDELVSAADAISPFFRDRSLDVLEHLVLSTKPIDVRNADAIGRL